MKHPAIDVESCHHDPWRPGRMDPSLALTTRLPPRGLGARHTAGPPAFGNNGPIQWSHLVGLVSFLGLGHSTGMLDLQQAAASPSSDVVALRGFWGKTNPARPPRAIPRVPSNRVANASRRGRCTASSAPMTGAVADPPAFLPAACGSSFWPPPHLTCQACCWPSNQGPLLCDPHLHLPLQ